MCWRAFTHVSHLSELCPAALVAQKQEEWTVQGSQKNPELSGKAVCSESFVDHLQHKGNLSCAPKAEGKFTNGVDLLSGLQVRHSSCV